MKTKDCMKCPYVWIDVYNNTPSGCSYGVDGSRGLYEYCYKDGKRLKKYRYHKIDFSTKFF